MRIAKPKLAPSWAVKTAVWVRNPGPDGGRGHQERGANHGGRDRAATSFGHGALYDTKGLPIGRPFVVYGLCLSAFLMGDSLSGLPGFSSGLASLASCLASCFCSCFASCLSCCFSSGFCSCLGSCLGSCFVAPASAPASPPASPPACPPASRSCFLLLRFLLLLLRFLLLFLRFLLVFPLLFVLLLLFLLLFALLLLGVRLRAARVARSPADPRAARGAVRHAAALRASRSRYHGPLRSDRRCGRMRCPAFPFRFPARPCRRSRPWARPVLAARPR